jgi:diguanylate cyclase (GGDEF)-like protein/PAS domain S-box-containing protein
MAVLFAVLAALVVVVALWYEAGSRRRRLDAEALLARRDRDLAQVIESSVESFLSFDAAGAITAWGANSEQLFGWSATEVMGKNMPDTFIPVLHRKAYENGLASYRIGSDSAIVGKRVETTALHRDGHEFPVEMMIWPRDAGGFSAFVRNVSSATAANGPLEGGRVAISWTDPLTSLGNRQLLEKDLGVYEGQVARYGLRSCIALIDIDDLKGFNDRYGHAAGDEAIVAIAERLASRSRSGDSVYRVGGDEFICLLPEQSLETGAIAVNRMCRSIEELAIPHEGSSTGFVTVSTGLALLDAEHLKAAGELLQDAEAALSRGRDVTTSAETDDPTGTTPA